MKKQRILLTLSLFLFILASSFVLLKLEKKQTLYPHYGIILRNNSFNADSVFRTYGSTIYTISSTAQELNDKPNNSLFLESKLYSPAVKKPIMHPCSNDSSLSVTIHDQFVYPDIQDIQDNPTRNKNLAAILLKYN